MVLHCLEDRIYRLLPVVLTLLIERVSLIDEEYAPHGLLDLLLCLDGSLTDISCDKA